MMLRGDAKVAGLNRTYLSSREKGTTPLRSLFDGYHQSTEAAEDVVHRALFLLDVETLTLRASAVKRARCPSGRGSSKAQQVCGTH